MTDSLLEPPPTRAGVEPGLTVCVFGGARGGHTGTALDVAECTGTELGRRGHQLLYGAGGIGVMGAVAGAAYRAGASITGVIPRFLYERERGQDAPPQRQVITDDMFDRKRYMLEQSDAFVALPGGYGTVDEVIEVVSMQALGLLDKPCVLIDVEGIWQSLRDLLEDLPVRGFADQVLGGGVEVVSSPQAAFDLLEPAAAVSGGRAVIGAQRAAQG